MAITSNNVQNVSFLRNQNLYGTRDAALTALENNKANALDGSALLARYSGGTVGQEDFYIKTLVGYVAVKNNVKYITIFDVEGSEADVEALRQEINNKLGTGVTSANTATAQLEALSGNSQSTSADTSVKGAKAYAYDLVGTLDYTDTAVTGSYVSEVQQVDGKITATTKVALPTVAEISEEGKPIIAVSESLGTISASAGTINAEYVNVTGNTFTASTVQGALEEIDTEYKAAIEGLDYTDTAVTGSYVSEVNESNGVISVSRVALPSVTDTVAARNFVTKVDETLGEISVSRGSITSSAETIVLTDNADGGVNFEVNIDNDTIIQDSNTKELKVASAALTQYIGDEDTIHISDVDASNNKTISSLLTISATTPSEANVKEQYNLVGASGNTIGATIKIYKDSSLLSVDLLHADFSDPSDPVLPTYDKETDTWTDIDATAQTEANQALCFAYEDVSGNTSIAAVPVGSFINEQEFASGVTWDSTNNKVRGVVDGTSEPFLTVGADGFKLSGVQNAIDTAVSDAVQALDADVSGNSTHVTVGVEEANGVITAVTVDENDIANASDLAELSGKTVTAITSSNSSITATIDDAVGNKSYDIVTDASKIKMSGFTSTSALSGISQNDSIVDALSTVDNVITADEQTTAAALTDLDGRLDIIESGYVETVKVNNVELAETSNAVNIQITSASGATTASTTNAIVVNTDSSTGEVVLGLNYIDCGFYD